jgi:hypothetical protein
MEVMRTVEHSQLGAERSTRKTALYALGAALLLVPFGLLAWAHDPAGKARTKAALRARRGW